MILKSKFQALFSSIYEGGKITASLMTIRQRPGESLRDRLINETFYLDFAMQLQKYQT